MQNEGFCVNSDKACAVLITTVVSLSIKEDTVYRKKGHNFPSVIKSDDPVIIIVTTTISNIIRIVSIWQHMVVFSDYFIIGFIALALVVKNIFQLWRITQFCTKGKVD